MTGEQEPSLWSAADLVSRCDTFGIPHFQRGLVWGTDAVSLLLESLFFGTPCGLIILWEPREPLQHGIPLAASDVFRYLVVDGQQRIRSLHGALTPESARSELDAEDGEDREGGGR